MGLLSPYVIIDLSNASRTWHSVCLLPVFHYIVLPYPVVFIDTYFLSQVSEVQMHESGSEPTRHTTPGSQTENGNNTENESRLKSSQTPPPEAPRVSHSQLRPLNTSALVFKGILFFYKSCRTYSIWSEHISQKYDIVMMPYTCRAESVSCLIDKKFTRKLSRSSFDGWSVFFSWFFAPAFQM